MMNKGSDGALGGSRYRNMGETDLLEAARLGCDAAYEELMARTRGLCLRVAAGLLGSTDDAADEVQNAFWKAYVNLPTFEEQSKFSTWMVRIVINCCMTRLRSEHVQTVPYDYVLEKSCTREFGEVCAARCDCPERRLARKELQVLVRKELRRLPPLLRQPLEYRYFDDLSLDEMASCLHISTPAAKSRLSRGLKYLGDRMVQHCGRQGAATLLGAAA